MKKLQTLVLSVLLLILLAGHANALNITDFRDSTYISIGSGTTANALNGSVSNNYTSMVEQASGIFNPNQYQFYEVGQPKTNIFDGNLATFGLSSFTWQYKHLWINWSVPSLIESIIYYPRGSGEQVYNTPQNMTITCSLNDFAIDNTSIYVNRSDGGNVDMRPATSLIMTPTKRRYCKNLHFQMQPQDISADGTIQPAEIYIKTGAGYINGQIRSNILTGTNFDGFRITEETYRPAGTSIIHDISCDGGNTWNTNVNPDGSDQACISSTSELIWRASLQSANTSISPVLYSIDIERLYIGNVPIANAGPSQAGNEGSAISFDGSASYDTDGTIEWYEWDFGDGSSTATGVTLTNPAHTYADDGIYTITLRVRDNFGAWSAPSTTIATITNVNPVAEAAGPYSCLQGELIPLSSFATDVGTADTFTYRWDLNNDLAYETPGQNVNFDCNKAVGVYTIGLQVTDDDGGIGIDTATVNVNLNNYPWIDPVIPNQVADEDSISWTLDLSGYGHDIETPIETLIWSVSNVDPDFISVTFEGDNNEIARFTPVPNAFGSSIVTFTITDTVGASSIQDVTITLNPKNDGVSLSLPAQSIFINEDSILTLDLSENITDPDNDPLTWNFLGNHNISISVDGNDIVTFTPTSNWYGKEVVRFKICDPYLLCDSKYVTIIVNAVNDLPMINPPIPNQMKDEDSFIWQLNLSEYGSDIEETKIFTGQSLMWVSDLDGILGRGRSLTNITGLRSYLVTSGMHKITLVVNDTIIVNANENTERWTESVNPIYINVISPSGPSATILLPINESVINYGNQIAFQGIATDPEEGTLTQDSSYIWMLDNQLIGMNNLFSNNSNLFNVGKHKITLITNDSTGLKARDSRYITITSPNAPSGTIISPANGTHFNYGDILTFEASGTDPEDGVLTQDNSFIWTSTSIILGTNNDLARGRMVFSNQSKVLNGVHKITLFVNDSTGIKTEADSIYITIDLPDAPDAPITTILSPANGTIYTSGDETNFICERIGRYNNLLWNVSGVDTSFITTTIQKQENSYIASFTPIPNAFGSDVITFRLQDDNEENVTQDVTITLNPINDAPEINPTIPDQTTNEDQEFTLDLSAYGDDPDNNILTWTVTDVDPALLSVTIEGDNNDIARFTPASNVFGTDVITIKVEDPSFEFDTQQVTINILNLNDVPTANAGLDGTVHETGTLITLDGSGSSDIDGDPLTYIWRQIGGTSITISNPASMQPTFNPTIPGTYVFRLIVNDGTINSTPDNLTDPALPYIVSVTVQDSAPSGITFNIPAAGTIINPTFTLDISTDEGAICEYSLDGAAYQTFASDNGGVSDRVDFQLRYGQEIADVFASGIDNGDLPALLADGTFSESIGVNTNNVPYRQRVRFVNTSGENAGEQRGTAQLTFDATSAGNNIADSYLLFDNGAVDYAYIYTLTFDLPVKYSNTTIDTPAQDLIGSSIKIQNKNYIITGIGYNTAFNNRINKIVLVTGDLFEILEQGTTVTRTINGINYTININDVSGIVCAVNVNGDTAWIDQGQTQTINGITVAVLSATETPTKSCSLALGATEITIENQLTIKVNGVNIQGSQGDIIAGDSVSQEWKGLNITYIPQDKEYVSDGNTLADPLFNSLEIGLDSISKQQEIITLSSYAHNAEFNFTNKDGKEVIIPMFWNSSSLNLGYDFTASTCDARLLLEGDNCDVSAKADASFNDIEGARFLAVDSTGNAHILQIADIKSNNAQNVTAIKDITYGLTYDYTLFTPGNAGNSQITLGSIGTITLNIAPSGRFSVIDSVLGTKIETFNGANIRIFGSAWSNGPGMTRDNQTRTTFILLQEEQDNNNDILWNLSVYYDFVDDEIEINAPTLKAGNNGPQWNKTGIPASQTDFYNKYAVSERGTLARYNSQIKKNIVIEYPDNQVYGTAFMRSLADSQFGLSHAQDFDSVATGAHNIAVQCDDMQGNPSSASVSFSIGCVVPTDGMTITSDTSFCPGTYSIPNGITISSDNLVLDCNSAHLQGSGAGNGIYGLGGIDLAYWAAQTSDWQDVTPITNDISAFLASITFKDNVIIRNCEISGYENGINVTAFTNAIITNNDIYDNANHGIADFIGLTNTLSENTVANNGYAGIGVVAFADTIIANHATLNKEGIGVIGSDNKVRDNTVSDNNDHGIALLFANNTYLFNNTAKNNARVGIVVADSSQTTIIDNALDSNNYGITVTGFFTDGISINTITGNRVTNNTNAGIQLSDLFLGQLGDKNRGHTVLNNNVNDNYLDNPGAADILIRDLKNNGHITGNTIILNDMYGNGVADATGNNIYCVGTQENAYHAAATGPSCPGQPTFLPGTVQDRAVTDGDTVTLSPIAIDPDGGIVTITISDPVGNDGIWNPSYADIGVHTITIIATDDQGESATTTLDITVTEANYNTTIYLLKANTGGWLTPGEYKYLGNMYAHPADNAVARALLNDNDLSNYVGIGAWCLSSICSASYNGTTIQNYFNYAQSRLTAQQLIDINGILWPLYMDNGGIGDADEEIGYVTFTVTKI